MHSIHSAPEVSVAVHSFLADGNPFVRRSRVRRNGLVQLGWAHFWLLGSILAAMLSMFAALIAMMNVE
jgi:hypothetical protein